LLLYAISHYVDDSGRGYASIAKALWGEERYLQLCTLLGTYFSFGAETFDAAGCLSYHKMQLYPSRQPQFLGFVLDTEKRRVRLPEDKLAYLTKRFEGWLAQPQLGDQDLRCLAGLLVSIRPAVPLGMAMVHDCYQLVAERYRAPGLLGNEAAVQHVLVTLCTYLPLWNGSRWFSLAVSLRLESDYSPSGKGGVIVRARITDGSLLWEAPPITMTARMCSDFAPDEQLYLDAGRMSSVLGEVLASEEILRVAIQQVPHLIAGHRIIASHDGCGAVHATNRMYSPIPAVHRAVWRCHAAAIGAGGELAAEWVPRELNQAADDASKEPDPSAWGIRDADFARITRELLPHDPHGRQLTVDAFAGTNDARCKLFIARTLVPDCAAVNAFVNGALLAGNDRDTGNKHLAWINGPWDKMLDIYILVTRYYIDCIILWPDWPRPWRQLMELLPVVGPEILLKPAPGRFRRQCRVPKQDLGPPKFSTRAVLVIWPRPTDAPASPSAASHSEVSRSLAPSVIISVLASPADQRA